MSGTLRIPNFGVLSSALSAPAKIVNNEGKKLLRESSRERIFYTHSIEMSKTFITALLNFCPISQSSLFMFGV